MSKAGCGSATNRHFSPTISDPTMILLNVYRLNDSSMGFYHTGLVYDNDEFTFCQDTGIYCHSPRDCTWATYLGSVRLGSTLTKRKCFNLIILGEERDSVMVHQTRLIIIHLLTRVLVVNFKGSLCFISSS